MSGRTALIFGATGAVGKALVKEVLTNGKYAQVITLGRRPVKLDETIPQYTLAQEVVAFDQLENHRSIFKGVDELADVEKFISIDQTYVLNVARLVAEENRTSDGLAPAHFLYCSSSGASKASFLVLLRTKAETEEALTKIGFSRVSIYRPTALLTHGPREVPRFGDSFFRNVFGPFSKTFNLHWAVDVSTVAKAMSKTAESDITHDGTETKVDLYLTKDIEEIAAN